MRRFLLLTSALVALAVLSAAGAATAKVPPKHKLTSHAAAKAAVKKPAKAKPARAKAKPRHRVAPTAAPVGRMHTDHGRHRHAAAPSVLVKWL